MSLTVLVSHLAVLTARYRALPTLGFTHFQPGWQTCNAVDVGASLLFLRSVCMTPRCDAYRICCGICTTPNQHATISGFAVSKEQLAHRPASCLFDRNHKKVEQLDQLVTKLSGFKYAYPATGQTYSCNINIDVLVAFTSLGAIAHKFTTDLQLLANLKVCARPA